MQKLDHQVRLKNLTLNCSSTTAFQREQQESRFLISKIINANYYTTFWVGKLMVTWKLLNTMGNKLFSGWYRFLRINSSKVYSFYFVMRLACLEQNLICWRNKWKWKWMKSIFHLTIRSIKLKKRNNWNESWWKLYFTWKSVPENWMSRSRFSFFLGWRFKK